MVRFCIATSKANKMIRTVLVQIALVTLAGLAVWHGNDPSAYLTGALLITALSKHWN